MRVLARRLLVAAALFPLAACAQKPEYEFYTDFRTFEAAQYGANPSTTPEKILAAYLEKLARDGVPEKEIARRKRLLVTGRPGLEADRWDRFYTDSTSRYNREPNGYLKSVVTGLRPGVALDYGMGTGRNALYLAALGWSVYGFDPSGAAVSIARKRADELGLTLHAAAVADSKYDFGKRRFDLILFSWTMPLVNPKLVAEALKPGGIVVMECGAGFVGRNEMLKKFDALRIVRYEIVRAVSDFYDRRETDVLRMIAVKP